VNPNQQHKLKLWEEFSVSRSPILSRGNNDWPANRILLQLASEYADDSMVTEAAEEWAQEIGCNWPRLTNLRRPVSTLDDEIKGVYLDPRPKRGIDREGHTDRVMGAIPSSGGKVISWALDGTIKIWEATTGAPVHTIKAHEERVIGVKELPGGCFASWGRDQCIKIYCQKDFSLKWEHHFISGFVERIDILRNTRMAILLSDARVLFLNLNNMMLKEAGTHKSPLSVAYPMDGKFITAAWDGTIKVWDSESGLELASTGIHDCAINQVEVLDGSVVFAASIDGRISSWNFATKDPPKLLTNLNEQVDWLLAGRADYVVAVNSSGLVCLLNSAGADRQWDLGRRVNGLCFGQNNEAKLIYALVDNREVLELNPDSKKANAIYKHHEEVLCIGIEEEYLAACLVNGDVIRIEDGAVKHQLNDLIIPLESSSDGKVYGFNENQHSGGKIAIPVFIRRHMRQSGLKLASPFAHAYSYKPSIALPVRDSTKTAQWHHVRPLTPLFALNNCLMVCELNDRIVFLQCIPASQEEATI